MKIIHLAPKRDTLVIVSIVPFLEGAAIGTLLCLSVMSISWVGNLPEDETILYLKKREG